MVREMTEYLCVVHYDDEQTAEISVFASPEAETPPKWVRRAARDKAEHIGERNAEGGCLGERPHPTYAQISEERQVTVEADND